MRFSLLRQLRLEWIAVAAASIGLLPACSHAGTFKTVAYASLPGVPQEQTSIDLYPCSASSDALVVYLHGGAWTKGDKVNVHSMPDFFAKNNVCFASANYPLTSLVKGAVMDLQVAALSDLDIWLQRYGRDASRRKSYRNVSLIGHSAGAHLVALADKRNGWNPNVKNLFLMDSGSYDIEAKLDQSSADYRALMHRLLRLDMYAPSEYGSVLKRYSPALLPPLSRSGSAPLNVHLLTSRGPIALSSAVSLRDSYRPAAGYSATLYPLPWKHNEFPRRIGNDQAFSQKLLGRVKESAPRRGNNLPGW